MNLELLKEDFSICKVKHLDEKVLMSKYVFVCKTDDEISVVCESSKIPNEVEDIENDWRCFRIEGILDFSLIGIISKISTILANENISIFVLSTFRTDYIMIKKKFLEKAINALKKENYVIKY